MNRGRAATATQAEQMSPRNVQYKGKSHKYSHTQVSLPLLNSSDKECLLKQIDDQWEESEMGDEHIQHTNQETCQRRSLLGTYVRSGPPSCSRDIHVISQCALVTTATSHKWAPDHDDPPFEDNPFISSPCISASSLPYANIKQGRLKHSTTALYRMPAASFDQQLLSSNQLINKDITVFSHSSPIVTELSSTSSMSTSSSRPSIAHNNCRLKTNVDSNESTEMTEISPPKGSSHNRHEFRHMNTIGKISPSEENSKTACTATESAHAPPASSQRRMTLLEMVESRKKEEGLVEPKRIDPKADIYTVLWFARQGSTDNPRRNSQVGSTTKLLTNPVFATNTAFDETSEDMKQTPHSQVQFSQSHQVIPDDGSYVPNDPVQMKSDDDYSAFMRKASQRSETFSTASSTAPLIQ